MPADGPDSDPTTQAADPAARLEHVVDDHAARQAAFEWAAGRLVEGSDAEALVATLIGQGWPDEEATELVEEARRQTRSERGVVTRQDVVREANRHYYRGMRGPFIGFPTLAAASRLLHSLRSVLTLRKRR